MSLYFNFTSYSSSTLLFVVSAKLKLRVKLCRDKIWDSVYKQYYGQFVVTILRACSKNRNYVQLYM